MRFRTAQRKKMVAIAAALVACMMMAGCGASANTVDISSMEFNPQGKTIKQIAAALESGETTSRQLVSYYLTESTSMMTTVQKSMPSRKLITCDAAGVSQ